jgi:hypothetical protein
MPIVLIKAFEMRRRNFMFFRWRIEEIVAEIESEEGRVHLFNEGLPEWWQAHTLK